jgi:hypothetical protein
MSESAECCPVAHPYGQLQLNLPGIEPLTVEEELSARLKELDEAGVETVETLGLALQLSDLHTLSDRVKRVQEVIDVRAMYDSQGAWLVPGGLEVEWLCEQAIQAYIAGLPLATLLCCHAACERVLAGCLEVSQPRYGELRKNWERWGLGPLNAEAFRRGIVSTELNADLNQMNDNRRATAHFKHPLDPDAVWNRMFATRARPDGSVPVDELRVLMNKDALEACRATMRLIRSPGEGFNSFESLLPSSDAEDPR